MSVAGSRTVLVATRNPGKLRELRPLFAGHGYEVVDLVGAGIVERPEDEEAIEAFDSFEENALAKAQYFFRFAGGLPVVADDSGLVVDALGGRPGVRSRRFAGEDGPRGVVDAANNALLLQELARAADRSARFVCAAAWVDSSHALVRLGEAQGRILEQPRGIGGFGYDPLFLSADLGISYSEASVAEKEAVSHRGRAFRALLTAVESGATRAVDE